jgi:hypothetical protein
MSFNCETIKYYLKCWVGRNTAYKKWPVIFYIWRHPLRNSFPTPNNSHCQTNRQNNKWTEFTETILFQKLMLVMGSVLCMKYSVLIFQFYYFKSSFNIDLTSTPRSSRVSHPIKFTDHNCACVLLASLLQPLRVPNLIPICHCSGHSDASVQVKHSV